MDYIQLSGTVHRLFPSEKDANGYTVLKVMLSNLVASGATNAKVDTNALLMIRILNEFVIPPFTPGHPITIKGVYVQMGPEELSIIHSTHAPLGFIRYDGQIYR